MNLLSNSADSDQNERIAVLETKVDGLHDDVKELMGLLKPMVALYQAGKIVLSIGGFVLSYTHWDQVSVFLYQLFAAPKH
jgi:ribosomal protein L16 Arg81 hydroxylase